MRVRWQGILPWWQTVISVVAPQRCPACDAVVPPWEQGPFCHLCGLGVDDLTSPRCPRCADRFDSGEEDRLCGSCLRDPPPFRAVFAPYVFGGPVAEAIARLKYDMATWYASRLAGAMAAVLPKDRRWGAVVPVPLTASRLRHRGFNQAALLARAVARHLRAPVRHWLSRRDDGASQVGRTRAQRLGAVAFDAQTPCPSVPVLLVDDVVTTGATARAAARALVRAGAGAVDVCCLARTVRGL